LVGGWAGSATANLRTGPEVFAESKYASSMSASQSLPRACEKAPSSLAKTLATARALGES
jgi:hypothetical protein